MTDRHSDNFRARLSALSNLALILLSLAALHFPAHAKTPRRIVNNGSLKSSPGPALDLFTTILDSAEAGSGSLHIAFNPFAAKTTGSHVDQTAFWEIDPGTVAQVTFELDHNGWKQLALSFGDHPIKVQVAFGTPNPGKLRIGKITYKPDGTVKGIFEPGVKDALTVVVREGRNPATPIGLFAEILANLSLAPKLNVLLAGRGLSSGPLLYKSAGIESTAHESVELVIKSMTELPLDRQGAVGCNLDSLTLSNDVTMLMNALFYDVAAGRLDATVSNFSAAISAGCMGAGATEFKLGSDTQLKEASLRFGGTGVQTSEFVVLRAQAFTGSLLTGSQVALSQAGDRTSLITIGIGSNLSGSTLEYEVRESGTRAFSVQSTKLQVTGLSGELAPDADDYFKFSAPAAEITIHSAIWRNASAPLVKASFKPMHQITMNEGLLTFNAATHLSIGPGTAIAGSLMIDTAQPVPVSGDLTQVSVSLTEKSTLGDSDSFGLVAITGGRLVTSPSDRLLFIGKERGPHGGFELNMPIGLGRINLNANGEFAISAGQIRAALSRKAATPFSGKLSGRLDVSSGRVRLNSNSGVEVNKGSLAFDNLSFADNARLAGILTGLTLSLSNSEAILSPNLMLLPSSGASIDNDASGAPPQIGDMGLIGRLKLHVPIRSGAAKMVAGAEFKLSNGVFDGLLIRSADGLVSASLSLAVDVSEGLVSLDELTLLPVTLGSHIESANLVLSESGTLSGVFSSARLRLAPGSTIVAARGRRVTLAGNSVYETVLTNPLTFSPGQNSATGDGRLAAPFTRLEYPDTPSVSLESGELRAALSRTPGSRLEWGSLAITGKQIGTYTSVREIPSDEYDAMPATAPNTVSISAPNRVVVVNSVPIATKSTATFEPDGVLLRALLAEDTTVFGVPLTGGSWVEIDAHRSVVLLGTIGRDTLIDGVPYSKGCLAHLPPTDADRSSPPCELVTSLAVRIKTSDSLLSSAVDPITGKADDIWLDIGPKAWRLTAEPNADFSRGATTTITIPDPSNIEVGNCSNCSALDGKVVPLHVGDITQIRLEKKGVTLPGLETV
ncbi:MAG TPA: hypothetical protein VGC61_00170, partial [Pyrinomonadaceae bacterium]